MKLGETNYRKHQFSILETRKINLGMENNFFKNSKVSWIWNQNYLKTEMQNGKIIKSRLTQDGLNIAINGSIDPEYGNEYNIEVKVSDFFLIKLLK